MATEGGTVSLGGHKVKKSTAYAAAIAAVLVIAVAIYRKQEAAKAAAAAPATGAAPSFTDPAGNQCAAADPSTGYCPGTPEDISAQEQLSASSADYGYGGGIGSGGGVTSLGGTGTSSVPVFTDNGSWAQYVEQMLGSNGSDAIAAAIAKYLSGQSVTSAQQTTIEQAIAIANNPPVSGSGGYPPSIHLASGTTPPTGTGYTWKTVSAPGTEDLAAMQDSVSSTLVTWPVLLAQNQKLRLDPGEKVPKGDQVQIAYPSSTSS